MQIKQARPQLADSPDMAAAYAVLERMFGYKSFRSHQEAIVRAVLAGSDALVLMPTGGGKSLCYQIPAIVREGTGVVVSPLIALMHDQVEALEQAGARAAYLNSSQPPNEQREVEDRLLSGDLDLIYVAPERLVQDRTLNLLSRCALSVFAIDEAHCVSQWGHDFRPEYRQLRILRERFPTVPRLALTATADPRTRDEIADELSLEDAPRFVASFDRPNIRYTIAELGSMSTRERLWRFIETEHSTDSGIVYCLSRKATEETAAWLTDRGRRALAYHAGLPAETRRAAQSQFLAEDGLIVVATIAFGMGIDKPDVRFVAHLNLPKSIEAYYQETGRAGRDGEPANAWLAYSLQDLVQQRQWIAQSEGSEAFKTFQRRRLDALIGLCEISSCRRQTLLSYFGEELQQPCGNCDNCLNPPTTIDGTVAAQKALSTVYRTGQRFGVGYVIDVLVGKTEHRIGMNGHDRLSVFGIGAEFDATGWRGLFRQLVAAGYLAPDVEGHGTLLLTDKARPLLRGDESFAMRKISVHSGKRGGGRKSRAPALDLNPDDRPLFDALKATRKDLATVAKVPPYVICHDRTLAELASVRPSELGQLSNITGLGASKIKRYGQALLDTITTHGTADPRLRNRLSATINRTLALHFDGADADAIANVRGIEVSTVYGHFAAAIEAGIIAADTVLPLDTAEVEEILAAFEDVGTLETGHLGPAHARLDGRYDYGILQCLLADLA
jgi:ATP-dependent DNA helicase RecQ